MGSPTVKLVPPWGERRKPSTVGNCEVCGKPVAGKSGPPPARWRPGAPGKRRPPYEHHDHTNAGQLSPPRIGHFPGHPRETGPAALTYGTVPRGCPLRPVPMCSVDSQTRGNAPVSPTHGGAPEGAPRERPSVSRALWFDRSNAKNARGYRRQVTGTWSTPRLLATLPRLVDSLPTTTASISGRCWLRMVRGTPDTRPASLQVLRSR
jgi:hypothetical protein